ncbi:MAG: hypothetical protein WEB00_05515 [Dehalococcoidia bacterium]
MDIKLLLNPANSLYPLRDGTPVFRIGREALEHASKRDKHPELTFDLAFGQGEIVEGQPLLETLDGYFVSVDEVISQFAGALP